MKCCGILDSSILLMNHINACNLSHSWGPFCLTKLRWLHLWFEHGAVSFAQAVDIHHLTPCDTAGDERTDSDPHWIHTCFRRSTFCTRSFSAFTSSSCDHLRSALRQLVNGCDDKGIQGHDKGTEACATVHDAPDEISPPISAVLEEPPFSWWTCEQSLGFPRVSGRGWKSRSRIMVNDRILRPWFKRDLDCSTWLVRQILLVPLSHLLDCQVCDGMLAGWHLSSVLNENGHQWKEDGPRSAKVDWASANFKNGAVGVSQRTIWVSICVHLIPGTQMNVNKCKITNHK